MEACFLVIGKISPLAGHVKTVVILGGRVFLGGEGDASTGRNRGSSVLSGRLLIYPMKRAAKSSMAVICNSDNDSRHGLIYQR
jgi:hypothetical protein